MEMNAFATAPLSATIKQIGEKPTIHLNDEPVLPFIYALTDSPGGRWTWEEIPRRNIVNFAAQGVRLFSVSVWLQDLWKPNEPLDVSLAQRQIAGILDVVPDAAVMIRLHVNAPFWWDEQNPDECTQYADGPALEPVKWWDLRRNIEGDLDRLQVHSLASQKWQRETAEKLREFCQHLAATPEGERLIALQLCDGVSHEWHYWGFMRHEPDTGPAMTAYFRQWARQNYADESSLQAAWKDADVTFNTIEVPALQARLSTQDGLFREPQSERRTIDYFRCQHDAVADAILDLSHVVKESWPRPLLMGVFYGYFFMMFSRQAAGGHLAMERILNSPDIDYLSGPQSYWTTARGMGGSGQSRGLLALCRLYGKLWLDEMDQVPDVVRYWNTGEDAETDGGREYAQTWGEFGKEGAAFANRVKDDLAIISRNVAYSITRGMGMWFYDFGPNKHSGWWDRPEFLKQVKAIRELFQVRLATEFKSDADVLVVYDSNVYTQFSGRFWNPFTNLALDEMASDLYHAGVVFDDVYLDDLKRVDLSRYKAVVFANTWRMSTRQRQFVMENVAHDGRHLIWNYLSGYSDGEKNSLEFVSQTTGFPLVQTSSGATPTLEFNVAGYPTVSYGLQEPVEPFAVLREDAVQQDGGIVSLATLQGTRSIAAARRAGAESTSWYFALPWHDPKLMRAVLTEAGVHIYNTEGDVVHSGLGVLCVHTLEGGKRSIKLNSGSTLDMELPPHSTTFLDAATGEILLDSQPERLR